MTVYVEIVIFNNLCIDFLLGATTSLCRRRKVKKARQLLSAIIGSLFAVLYPLMPAVAQLIVRLLLVFLLVAIGDKFATLKDYLKSVGIFTVLTYALGGIVYGLSNLIGLDLRNYGVLGILMMSIAVLELVVWFVVNGKSQNYKSFFDVDITFKSKKFRLKGFYDTGNTLTDPLTGRPIVLLSNRVVEQFAINGQISYDGFVDIKTVNGESTVPIIELDEICCGQSVYHGFGAILGHDMKDCDVILQNTLMYN
ncbi:MAG: sigma-E processing peptidase SpoIIGA [Clostridia bacterium]|nr:sigma-E processing peptidase SpoIIGA [Clostridia bacterium]